MAAAGTIGGKSFWERPGSPSVRFTEGGVTAIRTLKVNWADRWDIVKRLTFRPFKTANTDTDDKDFPTWPSSYLTTYVVPSSQGWGGARLCVKDVTFSPEFDGKQPEISTDADNSNIATYRYARIIIEYGLEQDRYADAGWSSVITTRSVSGDDYTWNSDGEALTDIAIPRSEPSQEFTKLLRSSDIEPGPTSISVRNLNYAQQSLGKTNSNPFTIGVGDTAQLFLFDQVLLTSFEVVPTFRFGLWQNDILFRFQVAPAAFGFTLEGTTKKWTYIEDSGGGVRLPGTWSHFWDQEAKLYRKVAEQVYYHSDFNLLFGQDYRTRMGT
jgi:hypothetical protein